MNVVKIPDEEYLLRVKKAAEMVAARGLDAILLCGSEGDFQNVRYFTSVTPVWERLGVIITAQGRAAMITGPEGGTYCRQYCKLDQVFALNAFRSSMDPIPGKFHMDTFPEVFQKLGVASPTARIAVGNPIDTTVTILEALREQMPQADISYAPEIMRVLRSVKSENELRCLRESYRVIQLATDACLEQMRPGMTECNLLGIAHAVIYANGAETDGMPNYAFCDEATCHPLGRPRPDRVLKKNSFVQLGLSASIDGYCGSIGIPVSMGRFTDAQRQLVTFGAQVHKWTRETVKAGMHMSHVDAQYRDLFTRNGMEQNYVYDPLHGVGLAEVESYRPHNEDPDFILQNNQTYQMDNFLLGDGFGFRFETGICVRDTGAVPLGNDLGQLYELDF